MRRLSSSDRPATIATVDRTHPSRSPSPGPAFFIPNFPGIFSGDGRQGGVSPEGSYGRVNHPACQPAHAAIRIGANCPQVLLRIQLAGIPEGWLRGRAAVRAKALGVDRVAIHWRGPREVLLRPVGIGLTGCPLSSPSLPRWPQRPPDQPAAAVPLHRLPDQTERHRRGPPPDLFPAWPLQSPVQLRRDTGVGRKGRSLRLAQLPLELTLSDDLGDILGHPPAILPTTRFGALVVLQDQSHMCHVCALKCTGRAASARSY